MSLRSEAAHMRQHFTTPPETWFQNYSLPAGWSLIRDRLEGKRVLDIGCASGWVAYHARKLGAVVWATDIFETMVHPSLPFILCSKEALPFPGKSFDFVLTSNTLHHGDLGPTCSEVRRVLRDKGELISFIEPCISHRRNQREYLREYCAEELAVGIDERRPNLTQYVYHMALEFGEVYCYNADSLKALEFTDYEGAMMIRGIK